MPMLQLAEAMIVETFIEVALRHPDIGPAIKSYIKKIAADL